MPKRRATILAFLCGSLDVGSSAVAQTPPDGMRRVGILIAESLAGQAERLVAFRDGMAELGLRDGRNLTVEIRAADGRYDRLPALAQELVRLKVDVIVAFGIKALVAAKGVTSRTPLVIPATSSDLVAMGLITGLARPGGNITGSTTFGSEVMSERLEIARDLIPRMAKVAVLVNPANNSFGPTRQKMLATARSLKMELTTYELRSAVQLENVLGAIRREGMEALVVQDDTLFATHAKALAQLAAAQRLPAIGGHGLAEAGGLVGYGRNELALYRRSAHFVDRILKGAAPGDLPIEQASRFELWLNMKTAQSLGLRVPESLRMRIDNVIQ